MAHTIVRDDLGKRKICSRFALHKLTDEQKIKCMETSGDFISMCDQDPLLLENILTGDETWCYQFDPESKRQSMVLCSLTSPWPKGVICKNPRSKHCWLPSSTTKISSIRNLFLQVKPSILHFTMQFWTDCYSVSGGFGQSYTRLENRCYSTIIPLHTVRSMCANSWCRRWYLRLITLLAPLIWLMRTSSCFPAWRQPSKVHVSRTWMPSKIVWQLFCDWFHRRPLLIVSRSCTNVVKRIIAADDYFEGQ